MMLSLWLDHPPIHRSLSSQSELQPATPPGLGLQLRQHLYVPFVFGTACPDHTRVLPSAKHHSRNRSGFLVSTSSKVQLG
jgi:hypothetical protein